ncbi:MAG: Glycerol-3-phosphate dehydrogenase [Bacteroidota bacterium]|jgi:glycerol-3-phosphate dehydrogenase
MNFNHSEAWQRVKDQAETGYDICVIGGGASGLGIALDASTRGYKVLLIEKGDFASQTSSKSTKLIHGGVRYLEQAVKKLDWQQFHMVYKALHERKAMISNAPHLAHSLGLLTPCYSLFDLVYYRIGMWLYDKIAGKTNLKDSVIVSSKKLKDIIPSLNTKGMVGGILYFDGQFNDARYALAIAKAAAATGADILNYVAWKDFVLSPKSLKIKKIILENQVSGEVLEVPVKSVVNATGPFADTIRKAANPKLHNRLKVSRGAHIVLNKSFWPTVTALLIPKTDDGRVVFIIPWRDYILVGTTDDPDQLCESPPILEDEKNYLLNYFNRYSEKQAQISDITGVFVGQRPLVEAVIHESMPQDTKSIVRDHVVEVDTRSKLVSILGGKWTTYRVMAKDTVDALESEVFVKPRRRCVTKTYPLFKNSMVNENHFDELTKKHQLSKQSIAHLQEIYGPEKELVLQHCIQINGGLQHIIQGHGFLMGEIDYQKKFEMAVKIEDIVDRRWGISLRDEHIANEIKKAIHF